MTIYEIHESISDAMELKTLYIHLYFENDVGDVYIDSNIERTFEVQKEISDVVNYGVPLSKCSKKVIIAFHKTHFQKVELSPKWRIKDSVDHNRHRFRSSMIDIIKILGFLIVSG